MTSTLSECIDLSYTLPNIKPDAETRLMRRKMMNIARTAMYSGNTFLFFFCERNSDFGKTCEAGSKL